MGEESSAITFEAIYDMVRKEKVNDEIQKLPPAVYSLLVRYLKTKIEVYKTARENNMKLSELEKIKAQLATARKLIKELYERRERKVAQLAINKSRVQGVDEAGLLGEEKRLLDGLTAVLDKSRKEVLLNLVNARLPCPEDSQNTSSGAATDEKKEEVKEASKVEKMVGMGETPAEQQKQDEEPMNLHKVKVKFTEEVPRFVGPSLEIYGPFKPGDIAELPKIIVDILIKKEAAELA